MFSNLYEFQLFTHALCLWLENSSESENFISNIGNAYFCIKKSERQQKIIKNL